MAIFKYDRNKLIYITPNGKLKRWKHEDEAIREGYSGNKAGNEVFRTTILIVTYRTNGNEVLQAIQYFKNFLFLIKFDTRVCICKLTSIINCRKKTAEFDLWPIAYLFGLTFLHICSILVNYFVKLIFLKITIRSANN